MRHIILFLIPAFLAVPQVWAETTGAINHVEGHAWAGESFSLRLATDDKDNARDLNLKFVITCAADFPSWDMVLFLDGADTAAIPLDDADPLFGTPYPVSFETPAFEAGENWEWSQLKPGSLMATPAMKDDTKLHFTDFAHADWLEVYVFRTRYHFDLVSIRPLLEDYNTKCLVLHHK